MSLHTPLIVEETKQNSKEEDRRELIKEVKKQLWLSGPLISVSLLNFGINLISVMFVGHLGELALSGASMATSFASVTGFSLLVGMASGLDTLCGQSFGAKRYRMLGVHTQRAMFILMIIAVPLAIIWANTRSILILLGQDPEISTEAGNYAKLMVPCLFAYGLIQCLNRFLQTQNIVFPMMFCSAVTTLLHIPLCWIMVYKSGLGGKGAAVAISMSNWLNVILLSLYVKFSPSCKNTWHGFSKEALVLNSIPIFLKLAIPSALMVCLEMWSFELIVLLSGLLPNPKLETSVLSICLNTQAAIWMIPFGLSEAVSIRVSNELGAGNPQAARSAVRIVVVIAIIESVLVVTVMFLMRNILGYAYSNEEEVVKYVATLLPILALCHFLDALQCVLSGTARGCGRQEIVAYVNLGAYYLAGIPAAVVLAFVLHVGGKGLILGMICALVVQLSALMIITIRTDWEKETKKASDRVNDSITTESLIS
ncbi:protein DETOXIFICATION 16-like [Vicia villosa]|uniref:protein DETOXIFICATION 16-like n=1 Tax=Vicia villosa TaxID=3911 RepID=UPI00273AAECF|nr:protein DETOXIFICATION 16-like [Vicia villosa]